jgi:hypothetical protein
MQKIQNKDLIHFFWFTNGVEKLIVGSLLTVGIGIAGFTFKKADLSVAGIVIMELITVMAGASLLALYFYRGYNAYVQFMGGTKINVTGGKDFFKKLSPSFWEGKSTASIGYNIEVQKEAGVDVRKTITEFVSSFTKRANEKFPLHFSATGWEVKGEVMLGKSSDFWLSELMSHLTSIHNQFPSAAIVLTIQTAGETMINSTAEESSDETWAEARWRHDMERHSHDNDLGGNHTHRH